MKLFVPLAFLLAVAFLVAQVEGHSSEECTGGACCNVRPRGKCDVSILGQTAQNCDGSVTCTCVEVKRGRKTKYRYGKCVRASTTTSSSTTEGTTTTVETTTA